MPTDGELPGGNRRLGGPPLPCGMAFSKQTVLDVLARVPHPTTGRPLAGTDAVARVAYCDGLVTVDLRLAGLSGEQRAAVQSQIESALHAAAGASGEPLRSIAIEFVAAGGPNGNGAKGSAGEGSAGGSVPARTVSLNQAGPAPRTAAGAGPAPAPSQASAPTLPGVKHVVAVGAGKGGVGKSTVAVNLAVGLALRGHSVGLLDGDIYGPSLPTMLGLHAMQTNIRGNMLQPFLVHGIKAMTIGKLVDPEKALIWRGPMAHGAFKQLVEQTEWGELDYLVIDLPPGTGDVSLTMAQLLRLDGAVVVCTPQRVAQDDAVRAVRMFQQLGIDILGVVENMSYFIADDGKEYDIFGRGGAQTMAQRLGVPYLGSVPINMALRQNSDAGNPSANFAGGGQLPRDLDALVRSLESQVALAGLRAPGRTPTLTIS